MTTLFDFEKVPSENRGIILRAASDIPVIPIQWIWPSWLAKGKLHILAGAPGAGKTTIAMSFSAVLSASQKWPDGTPSTDGNVLIWSGEDDPGDTLIPRLIEMGADLSKVHFIEGVYVNKKKISFDPAKHMDMLAESVRALNPALLIIDPIVSAVAGDSHKNSETRRGLQPLVDMAQKANLAVLGITHFSKGTSGREPVERITGSLAFGALARVVFVAASTSEQNGGERIFCRAKSNIGKDAGGFHYDLATRPFMETGETSVVSWGQATDKDARQLLSDAERPPNDEDNVIGQAASFLKDLLQNGAVHSQEVFEGAKAAGFSKSAINRAKSKLGIQPYRRENKWYWKQQDTQATQQSILDTLDTFHQGVDNG